MVKCNGMHLFIPICRSHNIFHFWQILFGLFSKVIQHDFLHNLCDGYVFLPKRCLLYLRVYFSMKFRVFFNNANVRMRSRGVSVFGLVHCSFACFVVFGRTLCATPVDGFFLMLCPLIPYEWPNASKRVGF